MSRPFLHLYFVGASLCEVPIPFSHFFSVPLFRDFRAIYHAKSLRKKELSQTKFSGLRDGKFALPIYLKISEPGEKQTFLLRVSRASAVKSSLRPHTREKRRRKENVKAHSAVGQSETRSDRTVTFPPIFLWATSRAVF